MRLSHSYEALEPYHRPQWKTQTLVKKRWSKTKFKLFIQTSCLSILFEFLEYLVRISWVLVWVSCSSLLRSQIFIGASKQFSIENLDQPLKKFDSFFLWQSTQLTVWSIVLCGFLTRSKWEALRNDPLNESLSMRTSNWEPLTESL